MTRGFVPFPWKKKKIPTVFRCRFLISSHHWRTLTVWFTDPWCILLCNLLFGLSERWRGGCGLQACKGWQHVMCSTWHWGRQIMATGRVGAADAPVRSVRQVKDVSAVDETWKQRWCLFKKAKGIPVRNQVMLFSPWSLLGCSATRRTVGELRHLCFVKLNSHSKAITVPYIPFLFSLWTAQAPQQNKLPSKDLPEGEVLTVFWGCSHFLCALSYVCKLVLELIP